MHGHYEEHVSECAPLLADWKLVRGRDKGACALGREEEEEEGLFKADAVNEEDPERDRATQVYKTCSAVLRGGGRGRKFIIYMIQGLTP